MQFFSKILPFKKKKLRWIYYVRGSLWWFLHILKNPQNTQIEIEVSKMHPLVVCSVFLFENISIPSHTQCLNRKDCA